MMKSVFVLPIVAGLPVPLLLVAALLGAYAAQNSTEWAEMLHLWSFWGAIASFCGVLICGLFAEDMSIEVQKED
ncbi:hypothetical protein COV04_02940 [Candidatus Uhrbacteria bacterium CG10_big_fil_rev_8_21_14_0_10_48_11]|uniref:Uncharacterized protein n=1 Tax=Candidatus Uhrbacteria bacterium CG10_big_fil_rev_8_21_14_0_10_48_11 TaxID=1975037 RepID=A0A2M8LER5_9BACT|nr:MAG: hypothetical protein COV04_02940 [Candidatus Uhrbacteria bacterium CG10_big_fil_rev_8_21_14_0_10_48_11]